MLNHISYLGNFGSEDQILNLFPKLDLDKLQISHFPKKSMLNVIIKKHTSNFYIIICANVISIEADKVGLKNGSQHLDCLPRLGAFHFYFFSLSLCVRACKGEGIINFQWRWENLPIQSTILTHQILTNSASSEVCNFADMNSTHHDIVPMRMWEDNWKCMTC